MSYIKTPELHRHLVEEPAPAIEELKKLRRWICFGGGIDTKTGKIKKDPIPHGHTFMVNGYNKARRKDGGSATTEQEVSEFFKSFDECYDWMQKNHHKGLNGVGFVFEEMDGYVGIDIDNCVVNGEINKFAKKIITHIASYTEFSVNGTGVHIIIRGKRLMNGQPFNQKEIATKDGKIEVYTDGRYFTMTGNHVDGTPLSINDSESATIALDDVLTDLFEKESIEKGRTPINDVAVIEGELSNDNMLNFFSRKLDWAVKSLSEVTDNTRHNTRLKISMVVGGYYQTCLNNGIAVQDLPSEAEILKRLYDALVPSVGAQRKEYATLEDGFEYGRERPLPITVKRVSSGSELEQILHENMYGDIAFAKAYCHQYSDTRKYIEQTDTWFDWNGKVWERWNTSARHHSAVGEFMESLLPIIRTVFADNTDALKACLKKIYDGKFRTQVANTVVKMSVIHGNISDFNTHDDYIAVRNGIVNLRTGELMPHDKSYHFSNMVDIDYNPQAQAPHTEKFLNRVLITNGETDKELIKYVQVAVGYSLTGSSSSQVLFFCYGKGSNGKSVFFDNILRRVAGNFSGNIDHSTITQGYGSTDTITNTDLSSVRGKRLVMTTETTRGRRFNTSLVKKLSDGSIISSADKYEKKVEWRAQSKLWIASNNELNTTNEDDGLWRRYREIPFDAHITGDEIIPDNEMKRLFDNEESGILAWAVRGAVEWYKNGCKLPKCGRVEKEVADRKVISDGVMRFIDDCLDYIPHNGEHGVFKDFVNSKVNPDIRISKGLAYALYCTYTDANGEKPISNIAFAKKLKECPLRISGCTVKGGKGDDYYGELQLKKSWVDSNRQGNSIELYDVFQGRFKKYNSIDLLKKHSSGLEDIPMYTTTNTNTNTMPRLTPTEEPIQPRVIRPTYSQPSLPSGADEDIFK